MRRPGPARWRSGSMAGAVWTPGQSLLSGHCVTGRRSTITAARWSSTCQAPAEFRRYMAEFALQQALRLYSAT